MKILKSILSLSAVFCLASCGTTDPSYQSLAAVAERNPSPDAIVGMWHRKGAAGGLVGGERSESILVRSDGTMLTDSYESHPLGDTAINDTSGKLTWHYQGGGVWHSKFQGTYYNNNKWRIADGHLLLSFHGGFAGESMFNLVYERRR